VVVLAGSLVAVLFVVRRAPAPVVAESVPVGAPQTEPDSGRSLGERGVESSQLPQVIAPPEPEGNTSDAGKSAQSRPAPKKKNKTIYCSLGRRDIEGHTWYPPDEPEYCKTQRLAE
jgi:hypothetical protein